MQNEIESGNRSNTLPGDCRINRAKIISAGLSENLQKMARFRNLLVHMYWRIDYEHVFAILQKDLEDLSRFTKIIAKLI